MNSLETGVDGLLPSLQDSWLVEDESTARILRGLGSDWYDVDMQITGSSDPPASVPRFVREVMEIQSKYKFLNRSPVTVFEVRRPRPDRVQMQFSVPSKRLERKVRVHLKESVSGVETGDGVHGVPVSKGDTVGGGYLFTGREDWYPLNTDLDRPVLDGVVSSLHRHSMRDTKFVVQVLFQPVAGRPLRRWVWRRRGYRRRNYLRREDAGLWAVVNPSRRERDQAAMVDQKIWEARFHTKIRVLVAGSMQNVRSRLKEVAAGFNAVENPESGQYLNLGTVKGFSPATVGEFASNVASRDFNGYRSSFRTTPEELGALLAPPSIDQANLQRGEP